MKACIYHSFTNQVKIAIRPPSLLWLASLVLILGLSEVQTSRGQTNDLSGATPATPDPANPAVAGTTGKDATVQNANPNNPPCVTLAIAQNGGDGGDSTAATMGGMGGDGGTATATSRSTVPGVVSATAVGGNGGTGGAGVPGGTGGKGGAAKAEALGVSTAPVAMATGGAGGKGGPSSQAGGTSGNGGIGGNAQAIIDVQTPGTMVVAMAKGGDGGVSGGGAKPGVAGNGGNATVNAKVMATGANDVTINLEAVGGGGGLAGKLRGGLLGGNATTTLMGSTTQGSATLNITNIGGTSGKQSGKSDTTIDFTAQKNLTINSKTTLYSVVGPAGGGGVPGGIGGDASTEATLTSKTGNITGKVAVQAGPVINSPRQGVGGSATGKVTATAPVGNIALTEVVAAGWGGAGGGSAMSTLTGTAPKGKVVMTNEAISGSSGETAEAKTTGTGIDGTVVAVAGSRVGEGREDKNAVRGGVKAVEAKAKTPVGNGALAPAATDSALSQSGVATPTPPITGLTSSQSTSIAIGDPLPSDVLRETANSPNVLQQVVEGKTVRGLAGLGAAYAGSSGGVSTFQASADFDLESSVLTGSALKVGLFNPTFASSDFDQLSFEILDNGSPLTNRTFTTESQTMQFFDDDVLQFNLPGSSSSFTHLDFDYSFTAQTAGAGFGFELAFSAPDQGGLGTFMLALASLAVARWAIRRKEGTHKRQTPLLCG